MLSVVPKADSPTIFPLGKSFLWRGSGAISVMSLLMFRQIAGVQAQSVPTILTPQDILPNQTQPQPDALPLESLPSADDILEPPNENLDQSEVPATGVVFSILRFEFSNNTAFTDAELRAVTDEFLGESKTFAEVSAARAAVTQLYIDNGYVTSGAIAPPQQIIDGVVQLQIVEGRVSEIEVTGKRRLNRSYIRSRVKLGTKPPLNVNRLVEKLQLLQLDPLVETVSADLQASPEAGSNKLVVSVAEADSFDVTYTLDNNRSPSVGTLRNQLRFTQGNLTGIGDRLSVGYTNTRGSDSVDADYTVPLTPQGTSLRLLANISDSDVIEAPFKVLEIDSDSNYYELSLRHPLKRTPTQEVAIGVSATHQDAQTALGIDNIGPFPLSAGADSQGRTNVSVLRFFQEWTRRNSQEVLALRSQFNVGLDILDATTNSDAPDSRFFSWQGQSQWVRVLAPDTLFLLKGSVQLASESLLSLEQLTFGGQSTVRGYRQNLLSTDNGVLASAEARFPLFRDRGQDLLLQLTPFVDAGYGWNFSEENPDPLVSVGVGLLFQRKRLSARFDWGIPLISADSDDRDSLQEKGLYFTLQYSFF